MDASYCTVIGDENERTFASNSLNCLRAVVFKITTRRVGSGREL